VSDWSGQHSGVSSALAGLDMTMPGDVGFDSGTSFWGANLTIAVLNGTVPQYRLDDMAVRIVAAWYLVDREDHQVENAPNFSSWTSRTFGYRHYIAQEGYEQINYHVDVQDDHRDNIREVAAKGTVLLKNKGALPLKGTEQLVGVFGEDAADNQYGPNGCSDRGCDNGTLAMSVYRRVDVYIGGNMLTFKLGAGAAEPPTSPTWLHLTPPLRTKSALMASRLRVSLIVLLTARSMFSPNVPTKSTAPVSVSFALYHNTNGTLLTFSTSLCQCRLW
jgi:beta-glucosidase-like glycosyl hydrolase